LGKRERQMIKPILYWFPIFGLLLLGEVGIGFIRENGSLWWLTPTIVLYGGLVVMGVVRMVRDKETARLITIYDEH
jgi:hypothetical protein